MHARYMIHSSISTRILYFAAYAFFFSNVLQKQYSWHLDGAHIDVSLHNNCIFVVQHICCGIILRTILDRCFSIALKDVVLGPQRNIRCECFIMLDLHGLWTIMELYDFLSRFHALSVHFVTICDFLLRIPYDSGQDYHGIVTAQQALYDPHD